MSDKLFEIYYCGEYLDMQNAKSEKEAIYKALLIYMDTFHYPKQYTAKEL